MLKKLRLRLALICALPTAAVLCAVSLTLLVAAERRVWEDASAAFDGNIASIAYQLQTERSVGWDWLSQMETDQKLVLSISDNGEPLRYPGVWQTRTDRARLLASLREAAPESALAPSGARYSARQFRLKGEQGEPYLGAAVAIPARRGTRTLYLIADLRDIDLRSLRVLFAALTAASTAGLAAFAWWFSGRSIAPVERSVREQNEFVAAASHELRSPLATIRANAAVLRGAAGPEEEPFAASIDRECARLGALVDDLLTLACADAGRMNVRARPVEPEALLEEAREAFAALASQRGVELTVELPRSPLPVLAGDPQRLAQLLSILLDNALGYASCVTLSARREGKAVVLAVADNGPGIPQGERERVFRRFYRADPARGHGGHYGLGLAIAAEIARLHGASLRLADTPGGGLTVEYRQNRG